MKTIMVVDDRRSSLEVLADILADEGYTVLRADSAEKALAIYNHGDPIDAVLSDLKMPKMDGLELFARMNEKRQAPPFIIMSAYGTIKSAVQALKKGIADYLIKPLDYDELSIILDRVIREREMALELSSLKAQVRDEGAFHGIIGETPRMRKIFDMVKTVGPTDVSVLIEGETGTGKELLARALHLESPRKDREMVCINSAALADNLLEAELFGYVKGAFTGAMADRKGRLEAADNSTLFLDEIGQMTLRLQVKLLRFLQEMAFEPVGGSFSKKVNVRVLAATNLDLQDEIAEGRFLRDLFYRIEVIRIHLPPLRERKEDIYLLVQRFIQRYAAKFDKPVVGVETEAMKFLADYPWPGNIRQLENYIARGVILSKKKKLGMQDLPEISASESIWRSERVSAHGDFSLPREGITLRDMEKRVIEMTLQQCEGNKSHAAEKLGISRKTLYEKMARLGIDQKQ